MYMRARYYDPTTGQFLTRDPLEAITRSAYGYVGGSPLNASDPLGLCWGPGCWVESGAKAVGRAAAWAVDHPAIVAAGVGIAAATIARGGLGESQ
jgi:uncharacterized protein RhaS with RHS repeats